MFNEFELQLLSIGLGVLKSCAEVRDDIPEQMTKSIDDLEKKINTLIGENNEKQ